MHKKLSNGDISTEPAQSNVQVARASDQPAATGQPLWTQSAHPVQASLKINAPGDQYEQEAARVAEQVMRMPEPQLQRATCTCGKPPGPDGECAECKRKKLGIQRMSAGGDARSTAPPIVNEVLQQPGQPLDGTTRNFMESRFGQDFGRVRVHTGGKAAASAEAVNARAYTVGQSVVFGAGQHNPNSSASRALMAHELTHVVQQGLPGFGITTGISSPMLQRASDEESVPNPKIVNCDDPDGVLIELRQAAEDASFAVSYLEWLGSLSRKQRREEWNSGLEHTWFGEYTGHRFRVIRWRLRRISNKLRQPKLSIICNPLLGGWGEADPAINKIELRKDWIDSSDMVERRQTFIHEAGHIVGVWNTNKQEESFYGRDASKALAAANPLMALRNADNFGYYVVDRAA